MDELIKDCALVAALTTDEQQMAALGRKIHT
jgi:hypothetical protein